MKQKQRKISFKKKEQQISERFNIIHLIDLMSFVCVKKEERKNVYSCHMWMKIEWVPVKNWPLI